ncbi:hypothetical protein ANMWB30_23770 [Arthrobacter sp. MWB30]|nr:hypothetical protein ANMWB30_23770 [Arthrobacter sp. MWB30]
MLTDEPHHQHRTPEAEAQRDEAAFGIMILLIATSGAPVPFSDMADAAAKEASLDAHELAESLRRLSQQGKAELTASGWQRATSNKQLSRAEALSVVCDAATSWADELNIYIIPAGGGSDDPGDELETQIRREANVRDIRAAVHMLAPWSAQVSTPSTTTTDAELPPAVPSTP